MKLQYKLYLFFTAVVLVPLVVATVTASLILERSSRESYENRISSAMAAALAVVESDARKLSGDFSAAIETTDLAAVATGSASEQQAILNSIMSRSGASGVVIVDSAGNAVTGAGSGSAGEPALPHIASTVTLGPAEARWQIRAFRTFDADALSNIFSSQELEWGILRDGRAQVGSLEAGMEPAPLAGMDGAAGDRYFRARIDGRDYLSSSIRLPAAITSQEAVLFTGISTDVVSAASIRVLMMGAVFALLVVAAAGSLGFLMARNITGSLRELNAAIAAGIQGDLERRVEVRSGDEIGSLAGSFNKMQDSIVRYIADIEESRGQLLLALSYAGDILGSTADRKRLLEVTANAAMLATGAKGVWVESFAPGWPEEGRAQPDPSWPAGRPPSAGMAQENVTMGVPEDFFSGATGEAAHMLALDMAISGGARKVRRLENGLEMSAYPMLKDNQIHGALVAVATGPLEESRQRILTSLTIQAASALENLIIGDLQRHLAITDPMTGLYNFRYLIDSLGNELERSRRYEHPAVLAIIDLDDFKLVNDKYGHPAGDELLKAVAEILKANIRRADIVARYGGEEFAVVMPETNKEAALGVMEKLKRVIAGIKLENYPEVRVTASIGVAGFPDDADNHTDLLARADEALYLSKKAGKNRVTGA
ncbi:MAG: diguanylate cyclase [Thermoleophilia bacterium]|nr:diguanylate cyclase [Thermoleophilia bacterium]